MLTTASPGRPAIDQLNNQKQPLACHCMLRPFFVVVVVCDPDARAAVEDEQRGDVWRLVYCVQPPDGISGEGETTDALGVEKGDVPDVR
ncbi:hypothetical protein ACFCWG_11570 [Streptomyces sp. NPDC056390]|uniref:hypothetical protein n=1 Tax=Streptomyces sp. NPDC056390 TaxID=3345806 RepID=UPI0035D7B0FA